MSVRIQKIETLQKSPVLFKLNSYEFVIFCKLLICISLIFSFSFFSPLCLWEAFNRGKEIKQKFGDKIILETKIKTNTITDACSWQTWKTVKCATKVPHSAKEDLYTQAPLIFCENWITNSSYCLWKCSYNQSWKNFQSSESFPIKINVPCTNFLHCLCNYCLYLKSFSCSALPCNKLIKYTRS